MDRQLNKTITLKHLLIREEKQIGIKFHPNKMIQTVIKGLPDVKWSDKFGMAYLKNSPKNLTLIFEDFNGIAWINCAHFFPKNKVKTNNNPVQVNDFRKRVLPVNYRACPDTYLQKLELKQYSINTAKTYIHLFEVFINHYKSKDLNCINENDIRTYMQLLIQQQK